LRLSYSLHKLKKRLILVLAFSIIICGQSLHGQIHQSHLKKYAEKEAYGWTLKLNLSNYKTEKLTEILLNYKIKEGEAVLNGTIDFAETQKANVKEKQEKLKNFFQSRI